MFDQNLGNTPKMENIFKSVGRDKVKIVQFSDENKSLPDGSKIIYAENEEKIVLYHKKPYEKGTTFVYERKTGKIFVNGREGNLEEKKIMVQLGTYMLGNSKESDMVTITIQKK